MKGGVAELTAEAGVVVASVPVSLRHRRYTIYVTFAEQSSGYRCAIAPPVQDGQRWTVLRAAASSCRQRAAACDDDRSRVLWYGLAVRLGLGSLR